MELATNLFFILSSLFRFCGAVVNVTTIYQSHLNLQGQHYLKQIGVFPTNGAEFITFKIKGKQGARLLLYSTEDTSVASKILYYIKLGNVDNKKSYIHHITEEYLEEFKQTVSEHDGPELDENSFKSFWISWDDGTIKVGRGDVYNVNMFMSYTDECAFRVMDIGITGGIFLQWVFPIPTNSSVATPVDLKDAPSCITYSRRLQCPMFSPMQSFQSSSVECNTACSVDENCWGWKHAKETGTCYLMSGEVIQSYGTSSIWLKQK